MKILLTVDPEIPVPPKLYGGIERIVDGLVAELRRRGHQVGLLAHPESSCETDFFRPWPGHSSLSRWDSLRNSLALMSSVGEFKPDVVHSFSRLGYMLPLLPRRLPKIMSYQRQTGGRQIKLAAKWAGRSLVFTGCSEYIAGLGRPWGGDWRAIPNFVDTDYYRFVPEVSTDAPLVFLSRLERIKGVHTAIAIAQAAGRRLVIAGNRVEDAAGEKYWREEIEPHVGRGGIEYVGPVNDAQKNELLGRAAALLVPIEWDEPFGIVFAEALACGTPVISSPCGALPEIVQEGRHGFLVKSVEEGAAKVNQLGNISRQECRAQAEQKFSRSTVVSTYESLYRNLSAR